MGYSKTRININESFPEFIPYLNDIYFLYDVDKKAKEAGISGQLDIYLS